MLIQIMGYLSSKIILKLFKTFKYYEIILKNLIYTLCQ
uniref:Uncharacterized protein n=1 Tax=Heterorhabditis bacteriophora TaxID=37862 RepID=A0A1I7WHK6_HETBA